jgi:hypothetical protein
VKVKFAMLKFPFLTPSGSRRRGGLRGWAKRRSDSDSEGSLTVRKITKPAEENARQQTNQ